MHVQTFNCIVAVDWFGLLIFNYEMLQGVYVFFFFLVSSCVAHTTQESRCWQKTQQEGGEINSGLDSSFLEDR